MKSRVFKERTSLKTAKDLFLNSIIPLNKTNILRVEECQGRITSKDIISDMNVPHYNRAAMDGYAVKAENITSASISSPIMLTLSDKISNSTCVRVHTGSKIPDGADAVVMVEDTEQKGSLVEFFTKVHPGKNVGHIGEDIRIGDIIVNANHLLRGCDLATIASCGIEEIEVYEKPNVAIIPTGNELVKRSKQSPPPGKISETNSLMVGAYVEKWGGHPLYSDIIVDDPLLIEKEIKKNIDADLIVVCGGTSVGERDYVPTVLDKIGTLLVHGIGISPGKPTALGSFNDIPVICLPGYPAAGLITLFEFAAPAIKKL
ncbi:molybdopterin molybdenumtransferase MoeA, partial [Methanosalsum natronophilum]